MSVLVWAFSCSIAFSQRESLTDEFAYMSPKERLRIAKKEREESTKDTAFIRLMDEGESLFRTKDYEASLEKFKAARSKRPYNVNAKVKIEDLSALIERQKASVIDDKEEAKAKPPVQQNNVSPEKQTEERVSTLANTGLTAAPKKREKPTITPIRANEEALPAKSNGRNMEVIQRIFTQGPARVLERSFTQDGKLLVYRKVTYNWGGIYYFKGGMSITKREWDHTFTEH